MEWKSKSIFHTLSTTSLHHIEWIRVVVPQRQVLILLSTEETKNLYEGKYQSMITRNAFTYQWEFGMCRCAEWVCVYQTNEGLVIDSRMYLAGTQCEPSLYALPSRTAPSPHPTRVFAVLIPSANFSSDELTSAALWRSASAPKHPTERNRKRLRSRLPRLVQCMRCPPHRLHQVIFPLPSSQMMVSQSTLCG